MNEELLNILGHIERERGIDKELLFSAIQSALTSAARKIVGKDVEDISVDVDRATGEIKVASGGKEIKSEEFGRIAAQTAKQVIIQKIREAEREIIYDDFYNRIHSLCTGAVHRFDRNNIIVDLGKTEGILLRREMCPKDNFRQGDRVRALILEVKKTTKGPQIILSRTHPMFIKRLFE
jgi:N utilization substance protein A